MVFICTQSLLKVSVLNPTDSPSDSCWSCDNTKNVWRWDKTFISNRWLAESFPRSMGVKKFNLQITFMYIHFSHYANQPKYTAEIRKTLNVFCIYFLGQWFVKAKLKKLFILTCEFVSNFAARYWYKMVVTPCSRHDHKHLQFLPDLHHKMWWKEFLFHIDQALIGSSKFGHVGVFVHYVSQLNV